MTPLDKWHEMPPALSDRLVGYGNATRWMAIRVGAHAGPPTLRRLAAMCDRDIYAETVAALGYDPLGDNHETKH